MVCYLAAKSERLRAHIEVDERIRRTAEDFDERSRPSIPDVQLVRFLMSRSAEDVLSV